MGRRHLSGRGRLKMRDGAISNALPLDDIPHEDMAALHRLWLRAKKDRRMPARSDFLPEDFAPMLGRIVLFDVHRNPLEFVCRLYGSQIRNVYNEDMTGRSISEFRPPDYRDLLLRDYRDMAENGEPRLHRIEVYRDYKQLHYDRLLLPLGANGETVDMVLAASVYIENLARLFETS